MKKFFGVLCIVMIMFIGSISVLSAPYPEPGDDSASIIIILPSDVVEV